VPSVRISKKLNAGTYFITITVKKWYYVLDRYGRWNMLADSLKWFQNNKNLKLYGFVFMLNHLHLIVKSEDVIGFVRDFKSFNSKQIIENIKKFEPNVVKLFETSSGKYELWEKTNMPKGVENERYFYQKLKYIHENPVRRNYVMRPEDWYYSSANSHCELKTDSVYEQRQEELKGSSEDA
jgi:REP element-mobilizing transposase RayT